MAFEYHPIDVSRPQIRLLTLLPSTEKSDQIRCTLNFVGLSDSDSAQYEALSYVWGDRKDKREILVDERPYFVRKNLHAALRQIRLPAESRIVWADAICINQSDLTEVKHQILHMGSVYGQAARVLIWLGEGNEETDRAMEKANELVPWLKENDSRINEITFEDGQTQEEISQQKNTLIELFNICEGKFPYLGVLFNLPWWERAWVVQEAALPRTVPLVLCGEKEISFDVLRNLRRLFSSMSNLKGSDNEELTDKITDMEDSLNKDLSWDYEHFGIPYRWADREPFSWSDWSNLPEDTLEERERKKRMELLLIEQAHMHFCFLLKATRRRKSVEPKDKIFSLLGLLPQWFALDYFPDYNISTAETFKRATFLLMKFDGIRNLIYSNPMTRIDLPSWCIDFEPNWRSEYAKCQLIDIPGAASGDIKESIVSLNDMGDVVVHGLHLGEVTTTTKLGGLPRNIAEILEWFVLSDEDFKKDFPPVLDQYYETVLPFTNEAFQCLRMRMGVESACQELANGAIRKIEAADGIISWDTVKEYHEKINCIDLNRHLLDMRVNEEVFRRNEIPSTVWAPMLTQLDVKIRQREEEFVGWDNLQHSFFTASESGYYGKAPGVVKEGDILALFIGARRPSILRPCGSSFQFISFAIVPYIMNGELVEEFGTEKQREFHLV